MSKSNEGKGRIPDTSKLPKYSTKDYQNFASAHEGPVDFMGPDGIAYFESYSYEHADGTGIFDRAKEYVVSFNRRNNTAYKLHSFKSNNRALLVDDEGNRVRLYRGKNGWTKA